MERESRWALLGEIPRAPSGRSRRRETGQRPRLSHRVKRKQPAPIERRLSLEENCPAGSQERPSEVPRQVEFGHESPEEADVLVARADRRRDVSAGGSVSACASRSPNDQALAGQRGEASRRLSRRRSHTGRARSGKRTQQRLPLSRAFRRHGRRRPVRTDVRPDRGSSRASVLLTRLSPMGPGGLEPPTNGL